VPGARLEFWSALSCVWREASCDCRPRASSSVTHTNLTRVKYGRDAQQQAFASRPDFIRTGVGKQNDALVNVLCLVHPYVSKHGSTAGHGCWGHCRKDSVFLLFNIEEFMRPLF